MNLAQKTKLLKEKVEKVFSTFDIPNFPNVDSILKNLTSEKVQEISELHTDIENLLYNEDWNNKLRDKELITYLHDTKSIANAWYFANAVKTECKSREVISPEEFLKKWKELPPSSTLDMDDRAFYFQPQESEMLKCNEQTKKFLLKAGLPGFGATLQFVEGLIPHILDEWGSPEDWSEEDRKALQNYSQFGDDGSGNPVCIDHNNADIIVMLDHDYGFVPKLFINSSIAQFAESLLCYENFIDKCQKLNGEDAFVDGNFSEELLKELEIQLTEIDCRAMMHKCFWFMEINSLHVLSLTYSLDQLLKEGEDF